MNLDISYTSVRRHRWFTLTNGIACYCAISFGARVSLQKHINGGHCGLIVAHGVRSIKYKIDEENNRRYTLCRHWCVVSAVTNPTMHSYQLRYSIKNMRRVMTSNWFNKFVCNNIRNKRTVVGDFEAIESPASKLLANLVRKVMNATPNEARVRSSGPWASCRLLECVQQNIIKMSHISSRLIHGRWWCVSTHGCLCNCSMGQCHSREPLGRYL